MSPAPLTVDSQQERQLKTLARGFEALLLTTQQIATKEKILEERLKYAYDEYLKLSGRFPGGFDTHTKLVSEKILGRHFEYESPQKHTINHLDVVKSLEESGNVGDSSLTAITEGLECYKSVLNPPDETQTSDLNSCLVATRAGSLEKDFTTKGTRGSLRCPFTKPHRKPSENGVTNGIENALPTLNGDTCGHKKLDPINTEKHDRRSSQAPSARTSTTQCPVSRCPIRFLNQHSPEEIADYVERHKHEIPRSHAICVKRYSKDSRQLDAKYGSLINMIRGLSEKHQAFLPGQSRSSVPTASSSVERVEKWAEEVGMKSKVQTLTKDGDDPERENDRKGHFDRPLREVRVGESPSRPWGIHVPVPPFPERASSAHSPTVTVPGPIENKSNKDIAAGVSPVQPLPNATRPAGRCPFGHGARIPPDHPALDTETARNPEKVPEAPKVAKEEGVKPEKPPEIPYPSISPAPGIVLNGPMFFGFSPEQTAVFMQQLARGGLDL